MKVVLFCGGLGTRLKAYSDTIPKPMVPVADRPILWHLMKYYAHYGHKDFILCLGYKGNCIKDYFLNYDESASNDFVWSQGGKKIDLLNRDMDDWTITFVETGANSTIGERLRLVEPHLQGSGRREASTDQDQRDHDRRADIARRKLRRLDQDAIGGFQWPEGSVTQSHAPARQVIRPIDYANWRIAVINELREAALIIQPSILVATSNRSAEIPESLSVVSSSPRIRV